MYGEPLLAETIVDREFEGRRRFRVYGGLHYIRHNRRPYFSLTYWEGGPNTGCGGAGHDEILKLFPQFADLAALHLSDDDGVPMHALENGFYWLGGTHWQTPDYAVAARHFRISEDEARALTRDLFGESFSETAGFLSKGTAAAAKAKLAAWVEEQRPRWKAEAAAVVAAHNLAVYGDAWEG